MKTPREFIGEEIAVETSSKDMMPVSFVWRKREYIVDSVLRVWQDWGLPLHCAPKRQAWRARRHRNCYLLVSEGRLFELYRERGKDQVWVLLNTEEKGASGERSSLSETGS
jgi:hypothetical protein